MYITLDKGVMIMKVGFRTPNIKKSVKARTTGKMKRAVKKSVNPLYGKEGMGYINNPKKAVYNKVYNKTTIDARPESLVNIGKCKDKSENTKQISELAKSYETRQFTNLIPDKESSTKGIAYLIFSIISLFFGIGFIVYHIDNMRKYEMAKTAVFPYILIISFLVISVLLFWLYLKKNKK